jgi:hypothetical protein
MLSAHASCLKVPHKSDGKHMKEIFLPNRVVKGACVPPNLFGRLYAWQRRLMRLSINPRLIIKLFADKLTEDYGIKSMNNSRETVLTDKMTEQLARRSCNFLLYADRRAVPNCRKSRLMYRGSRMQRCTDHVEHHRKRITLVRTQEISQAVSVDEFRAYVARDWGALTGYPCCL